MSNNTTQPKDNLNYSGQEFLKIMTPEKEEDDDQNFIKKDEPKKEQEEQKENTETKSDHQEKTQEKGGVFKKLKDMVFPNNNQVRTLDNEVGGLEAKKKKPNFAEDIWDDRPEEVAAMVSKTPGSADLKIAVNKKIHRKLMNKKEMAREALAAGAILAKGEVKSQGMGLGMTPPQGGYVARVRTLKQDRSHEGGNQGGGMWR